MRFPGCAPNARDSITYQINLITCHLIYEKLERIISSRLVSDTYLNQNTSVIQ